MGAKQIPEDELPPPYSVHTTDHASTSHVGSIQGSLTSHLQEHLALLPNRMRMTRETHSVRQSLDDASLLDLLLPEIDDFLTYLGSLHRTPKLAHLTLIPEAAVPPNAILSGMEEMRQRGEPCRVAHVDLGLSNNEKKSKPASDSNQAASNSQNWSVGREFSDWGRFEDSTSATNSSHTQNMLWWRDEDMARRLARHLQPTTRNEPVVLETPVQVAVEARLPPQKEKKGWFWGKKDNSAGRDNVTQTPTKKAQNREESGARMSVTAEEVAFRSENELGLMESTRGWAIVVVVRVNT
ncbi:hypothetical protein F5Y12DRAFT_782447 [Xylaria sp. FL1777]|nr:hypothetical protein F5Y12DRAFT_782447 [Xylaria sp. FL1777]